MTVAGWYDDGSGRQRWWDGAQWTEHFAPQQAVVHAAAGRGDVQRANLTLAIANHARQRWRVEAQGDNYAVLVRGHRANHILHLILTLVTAGLWAIVWLIVALSSGEIRRTLQVDQYGNVTGL